MCFCAKFGYSAPNGLGGVSGQTSKYTDRKLLCIIIRLLFYYCIYAGSKVQNSTDIYSRPEILGSVTFVIIYTFKTCHEFYMCLSIVKLLNMAKSNNWFKDEIPFQTLGI